MIAVRVTIRCDECFEQLVYDRQGKGGLNLSAALHDAEYRRGWQASASRARCPLHAPKARNAHAFVPGGWTGREPSLCSVRFGEGTWAASCGKPVTHRVHR